MLKRIWSAVSTGSTVWGFLPATWQTAVSTALTAVTTYVGFQGGGLYWALIGGTAVFAFSMMATYYIILVGRMSTVFEQISVRKFGITEGALRAKKRGADDKELDFTLTHLALNCEVHNHSERNVSFKMKRAKLSIQGKINDTAKLSEGIMLIPGKSHQQITFATLPDLEFKDDALEGNIEIEFLYGENPRHLGYLLSYVGKPMIGLVANRETKTAEMKVNCTITKHSHERYYGTQ